MKIIRFFTCLLISFLAACGNDHLLKEVKKLDHYPSASGIEFINGKIFIIGDDAANILLLDQQLSVADSIQLYPAKEKRIPKSVKPDLESMTVTRDNELLLLGSGSASPYRNIAWLINPYSKKGDSIRMDTFYQRLKLNGIEEINIEGSCYIPGQMLLANRGSKGYPKNQLIFTTSTFWQSQTKAIIKTAFVGVNTDSNQFSGVSGMCYSATGDRLILTVSTEDTRNNVDDGAIGKSYLWIIKSISSKRNWKAINPDKIIDLEKVDERFKGQKIESVCITSENTEFLYLLLAADNDDGSSTLFSIAVHKD